MSFIILRNLKLRKPHVEATNCVFEDFVSVPCYSAACANVCAAASVRSCVCFYQYEGGKHAIAAACLFSLAIFSCWPCQGPHNHPPTVGSSGLQYNGRPQTPVINLCHLFIHPAKHTCSPLGLPTTPSMSKTHATQWTCTCFVVQKDNTRRVPGTYSSKSVPCCVYLNLVLIQTTIAISNVPLYLHVCIITLYCHQSKQHNTAV